MDLGVADESHPLGTAEDLASQECKNPPPCLPCHNQWWQIEGKEPWVCTLSNDLVRPASVWTSRTSVLAAKGTCFRLGRSPDYRPELVPVYTI